MVQSIILATVKPEDLKRIEKIIDKVDEVITESEAISWALEKAEGNLPGGGSPNEVPSSEKKYIPLDLGKATCIVTDIPKIEFENKQDINVIANKKDFLNYGIDVDLISDIHLRSKLD